MVSATTPIETKVRTVELGHTGLRVSQLCFGTVEIGPLDENQSVEEGGQLLAEAWKLGVNFWDTSDDYGTHPHVAYALKQVPRDQVVISTKTCAEDGLEASLDRCFRELETDYIDLLLVHCLMPNWFDPGIELLREMRRVRGSGKVKAVGISTHSVEIARRSAMMPEVEVVMAPLNVDGVFKWPEHHVEDGTMTEMHEASRQIFATGKGVVAMKVLGGGAHVDNPEPAIHFVAGLPYVHAFCIGMKSNAEIKMNIALIEGGTHV